LRIFRPLAEEGNAKAQGNLGRLYALGQGVTQDYPEAVKWFRRSADQGEAFTQFNLGLSNAMKWYRKAADQGLSEAQFSVGSLYEHSQSITHDFREAAHWYQLAAEQGNADAEFALGEIYRDGRGVPQDNMLAYKWFRRAAENSDMSHKNHAVSELHSLARSLPIKFGTSIPSDPFGKTFRVIWPNVGYGLAAWAAALSILGLWQFKFAKRPTESVDREAFAPSVFSFRQFARRAELLFWVAFISLPLFTGGWQGYNWLKNESYYPEIHTLISSHEVCDDQHGCADKADVWKSIETAEIYTREDFAEHRHAEAARIALTWFVYGAIGCFGFAYFRNLRKLGMFWTYLRRAFYVNTAIAAWMFIDIWY
jgi:hypothetical protein